MRAGALAALYVPDRFNPRLPLLGGDAVGFVSVRPRQYAFQSTPPVAGRRCQARQVHKVLQSCFNPRLPLLGGDAGRYLLEWVGMGVSIHASRCWEAMLSFRRDVALDTQFQSTPPVAGRRCLGRSSVHSANGGFNPRLPLLGGDARRLGGKLLDIAFVSIHASRCWEAMRSAMRLMRRTVTSFNPRLPLLGGDALKGWQMRYYTLVSIHASRCWEAMPGYRRLQSLYRLCFNPRLPLLGGDATDSGFSEEDKNVSIHASRCWEAMLIFCNYLKHKNKKPVLREPFHS